MRLIRKITDKDVEKGKEDYLRHVSRFGARGIILDENDRVGMIYMARNKCYKLPGGGIEKEETSEEAFIREIIEETGYQVEIIKTLGYVEEHKARNNFMQRSFCYLARITSNENMKTSLSKNEKALGFQFHWMELEEARRAMNQSVRRCKEYTMRFVLLRDKQIIDEAIRQIKYMKKYKKWH